MTAQPTNTPHSSTSRGRAPAGPGWRGLDEPASVRFLPSGTPLVLRWRGNLWQVIGEPVSWSSSTNWWEPGPTPLGGQGSILTTRFWRFQAQTGTSSPVLEFDMSSSPLREDWWLRRVAGVDGY